MKIIYIASLCAMRMVHIQGQQEKVEYTHAPAVIPAPSKQEAIDRADIVALEHFPSRNGYYNQASSVMEYSVVD